MALEVNKKKILIVDDEVDLSMLFKSTLEKDGYLVQCCFDGESALQTAREFKPDLIMLDLMMPRLSGFDSLDLFRNTSETKSALIIVYSALSQPEEITKTKQLGADDYIVKSNTSFEEVISRLKHCLEEQPAVSPVSSTGSNQVPTNQ